MENINEKDLNATTGKGKGLRFNHGKLRYDLVEPREHRDMVEVLTDGAKKYFDRNWENGLSWTSVIASLKRHLAAIERGEDYDPESGRLHIAHAACNVHFLNTFYYTFPQGDDRPKRFLNLPKIGLDIDGVLADFTKSWASLYPDIDLNSWYLDRRILERLDEMSKNDTLDNFYFNLEPLLRPKDIGFEPACYVTSRPVDSKVTESWLDKHGFPRKEVITVPVNSSKVDSLKELNIDIFIDDNFENFVDLNKNGIFCYLFSAPWNIKYDVGHMRIDSLNKLPFLS